MKEIDFSIVIPSFKDARIHTTIESINQQKYPREKIEIVVMDGGSDVTLLTEMRSQLFAHDLLVSEKDHGIFDAMNKGISRASGSVIFILGSDDKLAIPVAVGAYMECFKNPEVQFVCAGIAYTDKKWSPIRDWPANLPTLMNFILGRQVSHFGFACRREVYQEVGHFNLQYNVSADFDFFLRLSKRKIPGIKLDQRLVLMRIGGNSSKNIRNIIRGNRQILSSALSHYGLLTVLHFTAKPFVKGLQFLRTI